MSVKNHPNFDLTLKVTEKLLQIQVPIKTAVIVISTKDSETAGSVIVGEPPLTSEAKFNVLLQVIERFKIPWEMVTKGDRTRKSNPF